MKNIKEFIAESRTHNGLNESAMQMYFYRIDVIDEDNEKNGYSLCVKSQDNVGEDNVIDYTIRKGILDKSDVEDYIVNVEDITHDNYELNFWRKSAQSLD